jgi:hypothetical protein
MAQKAKTKTVPHLLIDRFRFDSFKIDSEGRLQKHAVKPVWDRRYFCFLRLRRRQQPLNVHGNAG